MEFLEPFGQNRRIIEEFTSAWLADIPSDVGRLIRVSQLRDFASGCYHHSALEEVYSAPAVHQALFYCHEELFGKILEKPLEQLEQDLRAWLGRQEVPANEVAARWLGVQAYRSLVPFGTPSYLRDLFFSNLRVVLYLIAAEHGAVQTNA